MKSEIMIKNFQYFALALVLFVQTAYSQSDNSFQGSFTGVSGVGKVKLKLIADSQSFAKIVGSEEEAGNVKISFTNNNVKVQALQFWKGDYIVVEIHYKNLMSVNLDAGALAYASARINSDNLSIDLSAGSEFDADLQCDLLTLKAGQGSVITITGTADNLIANANTGAEIHAQKAAFDSCTLKSNTGSNITVNTCDNLTAKANTGGMIYYVTKPNNNNISTNTGGEIKKLSK
jgi:hypothetical protein